MTHTTIPKWQLTVAEKRRLRDEAIRKFLDSQKHLPPAANGDVEDTTGIDQVDEIIEALSSGAVTATKLCEAYIGR